MTTSLERRYRRLLRAYPAGYRRRRGDELLATLLTLVVGLYGIHPAPARARTMVEHAAPWPSPPSPGP
jgi:hypothetical protein